MRCSSDCTKKHRPSALRGRSARKIKGCPRMENKITKEKLEKYFNLTERALEIAKKSIIKKKEKQAKEIIEMVSNYLSDAKFFEKEEDFVNAFAAINYAHGWLDAGVRLDIFKIKDNKLFTIK